MQPRQVLIENARWLLFEILSQSNAACLFIIWLIFLADQAILGCFSAGTNDLMLHALYYFYAYANIPGCLSGNALAASGGKEHRLLMQSRTAQAARSSVVRTLLRVTELVWRYSGRGLSSWPFFNNRSGFGTFYIKAKATLPSFQLRRPRRNSALAGEGRLGVPTAL